MTADVMGLSWICPDRQLHSYYLEGQLQPGSSLWQPESGSQSDLTAIPESYWRIEMTSRHFVLTGLAVLTFMVLIGTAAFTQQKQDKYSLKVPDGVAFSEFRGYETWQVASISHSEPTLNVILANPVMIKAYQSGIPGNGKPFPDGAQAAKLQYVPKQNAEAPVGAAIPDTLKDVLFMSKDSNRFASSGGWGYGRFDYEVASDSFAPHGTGAKCGAACHTLVKGKDYVFTKLAKR